MYFILSKVLLFLLYPAVWVFALLLTALLAKSRKQRFLAAAVITLYIFCAPLFISLVASAWSIDPKLTKGPKQYSCVIVLGGFSSADKNGNGYFNTAADRFIQGLKSIDAGRAKKILVTGGNGDLIKGKFAEADWVKTQLEILHVPDSAILTESNSRNTVENAIFSKAVLQKAGLKPPYLLITSDFHMRRAYMIFKKQGCDVIPFPCNYTVGNSGFYFSDLIPDGSALNNWNIYFKEMAGYIVDKFK